MTIRLPEDLESSIRSRVEEGRFASEEALVADAVRTYLRALDEGSTLVGTKAGCAPADDPITGLMRDDAELMDEIVQEAYRERRQETWRELRL